MAAHLASHVHVEDAEHGREVFGPDDEVPAWALPHITNPKAWQGGEAPSGAVTEEPKTARRART